jgi:hypothetical protein
VQRVLHQIRHQCYDYSPKLAIDLQPNTYPCSVARRAREDIADELNSWLSLDFQSRRVQRNACAPRSCCQGTVDGSNPKSWILEGSVDEDQLATLDRKETNSELNGRGLVKTFSIERAEVCRFVRLSNIGRKLRETTAS